MAAQRVSKILSEANVDIDLASTSELRDLLKTIIDTVVVEEEPFGTTVRFNNKHVGKPGLWDGETEEEFKTWSEKFTTFIANAGDKSWRKILKALQAREGDEYIMDDLADVEALLQDLNIKTELAEDLSETLYDQLTQYTKGELLSDIQMKGPMGSLESYRKAYAQGRKKTAENVHRARNRVTRPEIAETMGTLEEKFKKLRKDIAYLKDIDAYDIGDASMVSILMDLLPDEAQKEISMKFKTTGADAKALKQIMAEVEKIIMREKDRNQSRKDRKGESTQKDRRGENTHGTKKLASLEEDMNSEQFYIWNQEINGGYGGFIMMAKRTRDGEDEKADERNVRSRGEASQAENGAPSEPFVQRGKSKGKGKGDRKCYACGEEGHYKAQCPNRWYVPKTVFGSWWNSLPFAKGKGKNGKGDSKGKGGYKGKSKGKGYQGYQQAQNVNSVEEFGWGNSSWGQGHEGDEYGEHQEGEWRQIGMLRQSIKVKEAKNHINVPGKGAMFNFKMLEDNENEEEEEDLGKAECKPDEMPEVPIKYKDDERHRKSISRASRIDKSYLCNY